MLKVRLVRSRARGGGVTGPIARGGRVLGEVEEYFIEMLTPGDTFVFAGEILRFEALVENEVYVSRSTADRSRRCRRTRAASFRFRPIWRSACAACWPSRSNGRRCPSRCANGWRFRSGARSCRGAPNCWSRPSRARDKHYLVCYPFEGRLAHSDAGHAADAAAGAGAAQAAWFRRQRICAGGLGAVGPRPADRRGASVTRRAVRRGHAGRRPRGMARRSPR